MMLQLVCSAIGDYVQSNFALYSTHSALWLSAEQFGRNSSAVPITLTWIIQITNALHANFKCSEVISGNWFNQFLRNSLLSPPIRRSFDFSNVSWYMARHIDNQWMKNPKANKKCSRTAEYTDIVSMLDRWITALLFNEHLYGVQCTHTFNKICKKCSNYEWNR